MAGEAGQARRLRESLGHPVVDADGHWLEFGSLVGAEMKRIGGALAGEGFAYYTSKVVKEVLDLSIEERRQRRTSQPVWWGLPTRNTLDRATAMMPRLLYERLDEFGIDFSVLFPTAGLGLTRIPDSEMRRVTCRAFNRLSADLFEPFSERMTPVAVIPMHHPEEAIAELDHAVRECGLKVMMLGSLIERPVDSLAARHPDLPGLAAWRDVLGLDSAHDYDPVWQKCVELGVSPCFHTGSRDFGTRASPTNFVYNHIGHFAAASEAVCKALYLGGVTRRFPQLKFAFMEGGVAWACQLYADLVEHWETRNPRALERLDPANLDHGRLLELAERWGTAGMADALREEAASLDDATPVRAIEAVDDFAAAGIERAEDHRERFTRNFYFGCEADDRSSAWAFARTHNPFGARLNTLFGSDIGHFDVTEMSQVLPELHGLVDHGLIAPADFRDFVFENPVRFFGESRRDFFGGTRIEAQAAALLAEAGESAGAR